MASDYDISATQVNWNCQTYTFDFDPKHDSSLTLNMEEFKYLFGHFPVLNTIQRYLDSRYCNNASISDHIR